MKRYRSSDECNVLEVHQVKKERQGLDSTARKCVGWAVACFVLGIAMTVSAPYLLEATGLPYATMGLVTPLQLMLFPIGAVLVGAAVMIQWFRRNLTVRARRQ